MIFKPAGMHAPEIPQCTAAGYCLVKCLTVCVSDPGCVPTETCEGRAGAIGPDGV